ncbi:MAG TPA: bifunctional DNA primase/polymerase [Friedmanniella sp.]
MSGQDPWVAGRRGAVGAALAWAGAGRPVFPCRAGGKTPLTTHGHLEASTDPEVIGSWWRRWPRANVAMPTGAASGFDVLDVDVRAAGSGLRALQDLAHAGLLAGRLAVVATPSGGYHLYFPADPHRPQRSWSIPAAHVDFRGEGGYVLVPGSQVRLASGAAGTYRAVEIRPAESGSPLDAATIRRLLTPARARGASRAGSPGVGDVDRLAGWVAARPEGGRAVGLFWAACRLAEAGVDRDRAIALELAGVRAGLGEREARRTVNSAYQRLAAGTAGDRPARGPAGTGARERRLAR